MFLRPSSLNLGRKLYHDSSRSKKGFVVTILDSSQKIARYVALLLKQCPNLAELRLYDKKPTVCYIAEDLSHIDTRVKVKSYCGTSVLKNAIQDADIVVTLGGCKTKPSEISRALFDKNLDSVRAAALHCIEFNPKAVFCIARPPIEAFVPLVSEEYKRAGVYDFRKIIGISSVSCMRANYYVGLISGQNTSEVRCPVVGGSSTYCTVAIASQSRPEKVHPQHYKLIQDSLALCEDDLLKAYGDCTAVCSAPAVGIARFVATLLLGLGGATNCVDCAFVKQTGHIGQFLPYMTSIVRLGRHGILSAHMPKVNGFEAHCLKKASMFIKENIRLGESFVTGESRAANELTSKKPEERREVVQVKQ